MKALIVLLLLTPIHSFAQSPFDGTWVLDPPIPQQPIEYTLANGTFHCSGCIVNVAVPSDGADHRVPASDYWDTVRVDSLDSHAVEITAKKDGKTMLTEFDAISPDGDTLTQLVTDTTETQPVITTTICHRLSKGPADSSVLAGTWHAAIVHRSSNGSIITYKCTPEGFSGATPLGEKFDAKFDGKFYPVEDDPGKTMVSAKLINPNEVELTHKRQEKIVSVSDMTVTPDGKTIHVRLDNKDTGTTTNFDLHRQQ
ncbi:MAG TPA: hypothetical protein VGS27_27585 [Candidatus Sulfotelmatobacter sp.]|nr:hypothetical protein [Candidatus Sulfotelmatobacter sp.]